MEALLLTGDIVCMILLLFAVIRVYRSGDETKLGLFQYKDAKKVPPPNKQSEQG